MPEVLANQLAAGALGASLSNVATTITLATGDGAKFPATGTFRILVSDPATGAGAEIITVASRSGDVLTAAARGQESTSAVAHSSGDAVDLVLTAGALAASFVGKETGAYAHTLVASDYGTVGTGAAIQAAIDAAAAGDVVLIPAGTWTLTSELSVTKSIDLRGAGIARTTLLLGGNINGVNLNVGGTTINHLRVGGFAVGTTTDRTAGAALLIGRVQQCEVVDLYVANAYGGRPWRGIEVRGGAYACFYDRVRVNGCADNGITFLQDGTLQASIDHYFGAHVQVEQNLGYGVAVLCQAAGTTNDVEGIYFDACSVSGNALGGIYLDCYGTSVIKNVFLRGTILDGNTGANLGTGNTGPIQVLRLEDVWSSHNLTTHGITLTANVTDFVIDGGHFSLSDKCGVLIYGASNGRIQNVSIMSNGRLQAGDYGVIVMNGAADVLLAGNKIYNNTDVYGGAYSNGVLIDAGSTDCTVVDNELDTGAGTTRLLDLGTRTRVWGNVLDKTTAAGFQVLGGRLGVFTDVPAYGLHQVGGGHRLQALATPGQPTVVVNTTGATSFWYYVVAEDQAGGRTLASTPRNVTTSAAAATVNNTVSWTAVAGAKTYYVLRHTASSLPGGSNSVLVGTVTLGLSFVDTVVSPTAFTTPTRNATAELTVDGVLTLGATTLLATPAAGAVEYDGTAFYATAAASARGVSPSVQFTSQTADFTGTNVNTAQPVFTSANDAITLVAATSYLFEAVYHIHTTGTTSHTLGLSFGGTATLTSIGYSAWLSNTATETFGAVNNIWVAVATNTVVTTATATATHHTIHLRGIVRVNAGGTFIPQYTWSAAPGVAGVTLANSYLALYPVGTNIVAAVGNWA